MDPFRRFAYFTVLRDASFATLAASTLMVGFSFHPPLALLLAANVALAICLVFGLRSWRLTEDRVMRTEPWRVLERDERPVGDEGRRMAREILAETLLRFARAAALAAIVLSGSSLMVSIGLQSASRVVAASGAHAMHAAAVR